MDVSIGILLKEWNFCKEWLTKEKMRAMKKLWSQWIVMIELVAMFQWSNFPMFLVELRVFNRHVLFFIMKLHVKAIYIDNLIAIFINVLRS